MSPDGIHHLSAITADGPANVRFYVGLLGLRLVKRSVNQDDPRAYHLFYGDEIGSPGSQLSFFVHPHLPRGRAGAGMVHRIIWRVPDGRSVDRWVTRLQAHGVAVREEPEGPVFADPDGLVHQLSPVEQRDGHPPQVARHRDIDPSWAIGGIAGVRVFSRRTAASEALLSDGLRMVREGERWWAEGATRTAHYRVDSPPEPRALRGAGTVHHVAWTIAEDRLAEVAERSRSAGARGVTPVIDRHYFHSLYFHEPGGVLFELASPGPGFTRDEPPHLLGERLALPPPLEHLRQRLEQTLPALPDTSPWRPTG